MAFIISSFIPFPPIAWWAQVQQHSILQLDNAEHFQKMSYRNRYYVAGGNGQIQLSVPLVHGRNQRIPVRDVQISNDVRWQVQHWRTIVSAYKRAPYFEYYEPSLSSLFNAQFHLLADFNMATIQWIKEQLKYPIQIEITNEYIKTYPADVVDLRTMKPAEEQNKPGFPPYYQLFNERHGFLPNLSILDLLFAEGTYAAQWLFTNKEALQQWSNT